MRNKHLLLAAVLGVGFVGLAPFEADAQSKADQIRAERREERRDANAEKQAADDKRAAEDKARATRYDEDGDRLTFENLPGEVKRTVGAEMGQKTEVVDVRRIKRDGKDVYRVDFEDGTRGRTFFVDESGKMLRELNSTEEGRVKVAFNDLPGPVKSALSKANDGKEPRRIYQVTDDRQTWYVAYGDEGRIARVDAQGESIRNPVLLSDRPRNADRGDRFDDGEKLTYESLPGEVKRTAGAEMGQRTEVVAVRKLTRAGAVVYRIDFDEGTRGRTLFIDESGKLRREMNTTEEGRVKVNYNQLPGPVKSALIQANGGQEPKRIYQVTRDRDTWYVAYGDDGRIARVNEQGESVRNPALLSDRPGNQDRGNQDRNQDRDASRANPRDDRGANRNDRNDRIGKLQHVKGRSEKVEFGSLQDPAKKTIRDMNLDTKVAALWNVEGGYYVVKLTDGRYFQVGHDGKLLEPRRRDMVGNRDPERVQFGGLPEKMKDAIREMNRGGKVETVSDLGDGMYVVEYTDKTYIHIDREGKVRD